MDISTGLRKSQTSATCRFLAWPDAIDGKIGKLQVRMADQAMYHQGNQSVFVGGRLWTLLPPPAEKAVTMLKKEPLQHTGRGVERQSPFRYKFYIF